MSTTTASFEWWELEPIQTTQPTLDRPGTIRQTIVVRRKNSSPLVRVPVAIPDDIGLMLTEGILYYEGSTYPGGTMLWEQFARFRGYTLTTLPGGSVRIELEWTTEYILDPVTGNTYQLPVRTEFNARTRTLQLYRTGYTTNPPAASNSTASDIGGTGLAGQDQGSSVQVSQVAIRLRATQDATATSIIDAATTLSNYIGKTNSDTFLGCVAYSLVCEGVSVVPKNGEFYEVIFEFLFDQWYHHEQVPILAADGRPTRTAGGELSDVRWRRLARTATAFNNIWGGDTRLQALAEGGYWV
jgi:hypothetical protein